MDIFGLKSDKLERQFDSWKDSCQLERQLTIRKVGNPYSVPSKPPAIITCTQPFIVFANKRFTDLLVSLAQLAEHRILDPRVAGSNPVGDFLRYHTAKSLQPQDLQFYCTIVPRVRNPPGMNKASPGLIGRRMNTHDICFFYTFISV